MTYLEPLRRNEAEHRARLEQWLRDHGQDPQEDAPAGAAMEAACRAPTPSAGTPDAHG